MYIDCLHAERVNKSEICNIFCVLYEPYSTCIKTCISAFFQVMKFNGEELKPFRAVSAKKKPWDNVGVRKD